MNPITISTKDGRTQFSPGERLDVAAEWRLDRPPRAVSVRLVWYTRGKGDTDVCVVDEQRFDDPRSFQQRECTFELPEAPFSFSGKLVSLVWAVEAVVEPSGESARLDIVVAPNGKEVELQRARA
jgi:hypothetical protein